MGAVDRKRFAGRRTSIRVFPFARINGRTAGQRLAAAVHEDGGRPFLGRQIILSFLGFLVLRAGKWIGGSGRWRCLPLRAGAAMRRLTIRKAISLALDYFHLTASAVWGGGLALLLGLWLTERKEAGRFAVQFSRAALDFHRRTGADRGFLYAAVPAEAFLFILYGMGNAADHQDRSCGSGHRSRRSCFA